MSEVSGKALLMNRIKFLALIAVFILPFVGAWMAFYVFDYRPDSKNYGNLVIPVQALTFPQMETHQKQVMDEAFWNKWTFVILDKQGCKDLCRNNLYYLRQMRTALGRDMDRVQNVLISSEAVSDEFSAFLSEYPKLSVVQNAPQSLFDLFNVSGLEAGSSPVLYLIDPAGNLMMTYPASNDASSVLSDMRRLLRTSQIG